MRVKVVFKYIGLVLLLDAAFMLLSAGVSLLDGVGGALWALMIAAGITALIGAVPVIFFKVDKSEKHLSNKESYCVVVGAWLASCIVGTLPYLLWGWPFSPMDAWFESVSGFTTTGSTIIEDVEALPRGFLFWRSCTHWIGGAGVVMFAMLILPVLGRSRMMVSAVEMSASSRDDFKYTSGTVVRILLGVYLAISAACFVSLSVAGMGWFDALNHAMSIASTGGFSTRNLSIAYWDSLPIELITIFFMVAAGIHFGVIFATVTGKRNNVFRSEVAKYWLACLAVSIAVITISTTLNGTFSSVWEALRYGSFQVVATATTTGFVAADTGGWGPLAMVVLMFMAIQCSCAGSTGGGMKADRVWLAAKVLRHQIRQQQHPNAIIRIKLSGVVQESSTLGYVMLFIVAYIFSMGVGTLVIAAFGYDLTTALSMSISSLGNVGPGFGEVGGFSSFADINGGARFVCTILMLLGRLEIFGLLQLFLLKWWK